MSMNHRRNILIAVVAGVAVAALVTFFIVGYRQAPTSAQASAETQADPNALIVPTIDEMCAAAGLGFGDALKECQTQESAAAEYVIAWMGFNGFLANGVIDMAAIQFGDSLVSDDPLASGLDPLSGDVDPTTGEPVATPQSASQIAIYCLGTSPDWIMMQECIAQNGGGVSLDSALFGGDTGLDVADPASSGAP